MAVARLCGTDRDPALAPLHPKEKKRRAVANGQDHSLPVAEYLEKKTAVVVRVFNTKMSRYILFLEFIGRSQIIQMARYLNGSLEELRALCSYICESQMPEPEEEARRLTRSIPRWFLPN